MSITGTAAGVPFLAVPPATERADAPMVVGWHLLDPPRTEAAFAAALPLDGLDAWRVYLGLPMSGSRSPGDEEIGRLGYADAVVNLHGPINAQAVDELDGALAELRGRFGLAGGPLGLLGGSAGSGVALEVATRRDDVAATVVVSPVARLRPVVDALAVGYGIEYAWGPESQAIAARLDFVSRAAELGDMPLRVVVGSDDLTAVGDTCGELVAAVAGPTDLITVEGMSHALAAEPGDEPAPQNAHAAQVDAHAVAWFRTYLGASEATGEELVP